MKQGTLYGIGVGRCGPHHGQRATILRLRSLFVPKARKGGEVALSIAQNILIHRRRFTRLFPSDYGSVGTGETMEESAKVIAAVLEPG
jgi:hypothetical protein